MIMIPMLIIQIFLFPLTASWIMNTWVDSRRKLALQSIADHLASTMEQLYSSLNHASIPTGQDSYSPGLPPFIEQYSYFATGTLRPVSGGGPNYAEIIDLQVSMTGTKNSVSTAVVLGPNLVWQPSIFLSNSTHASVSAAKTMNGTQPIITLWFDS